MIPRRNGKSSMRFALLAAMFARLHIPAYRGTAKKAKAYDKEAIDKADEKRIRRQLRNIRNGSSKTSS